MILILLFQLATLVTPGTDAVILEESRHFVYQDAGRGRLTHKEKVMILNREGRDYARYVLHYNTFVSVKNVSSTLMSADGTVIRRLRPREINDQSASDGVALIGDSRMKYFDMTHDTYPYIVETEYQFDFTVVKPALGKEVVSTPFLNYESALRIKPNSGTMLAAVR
ncbi:MAG: hypothetical protein RL177_382, partial [Bacteroidota bacterium]